MIPIRVGRIGSKPSTCIMSRPKRKWFSAVSTRRINSRESGAATCIPVAISKVNGSFSIPLTTVNDARCMRSLLRGSFELAPRDLVMVSLIAEHGLWMGLKVRRSDRAFMKGFQSA